MKQKTLGRLFLFMACASLLLPARQASGQATVYWDFDNGFDPSTAVIGPSGTVTWVNFDVYGFDVQVTFEGGFTFSLNDYQSQGVQFPPAPGVYSYHSNWGNSGSVIVNIAPVVTITAPADGATFPAPATFNVEATASDTTDDYVSDVEFFLGAGDGTNSIGDVFSPPYTTGITNLDSGTYTLTAVARDSRGWTGTDTITIIVTPAGSVVLSSPRIMAGNFLFDVAGLTVGKTNLLETSSNLTSWIAVETNVAASTSYTVTNAPAVACQFYRLVQLP